jgi:hypothetical protein
MCLSYKQFAPPPGLTLPPEGGHILGNSGLEEKSLCPCWKSKHGQPVWNHIYFVVNLVKFKATAVFAISQRTSRCNEGEVSLSARPGRLLLALPSMCVTMSWVHSPLLTRQKPTALLTFFKDVVCHTPVSNWHQPGQTTPSQTVQWRSKLNCGARNILGMQWQNTLYPYCYEILPISK